MRFSVVSRIHRFTKDANRSAELFNYIHQKYDLFISASKPQRLYALHNENHLQWHHTSTSSYINIITHQQDFSLTLP